MAVFQNNLLAGAGAQSSGGTTYSIDQSIRFSSADSPELTKTYSGAGSRTTQTFSVWFKLGNTQSSNGFNFYNGGTGTSDTTWSGISIYDHKIYLQGYSTNWKITSRVLKDHSAWYNLVYIWDTTNSIASERVRLYINGQRETDFSTNNNPGASASSGIGQAAKHSIGNQSRTVGYGYADAYMAEIVFIDGTAYGPENFGEYNDSNIWVPKDVSGLTFGTNGFHIDGRDSADLGDDESGQGNDFSSSGLAAHDQVFDTPTNNFCVLNPISKPSYDSGQTHRGVSETNLSSISKPSGNTNGFAFGTMGVTSGKWYYEIYTTTYPAVEALGLGWIDAENAQTATASGSGWRDFGVNQRHTTSAYSVWQWGSNESTSTGLTEFQASVVVGVATDFDNNTFTLTTNGSAYGSVDFDSTSPTQDLTDGTIWLPKSELANDAVALVTFNFGQDSTFNGQITAGGNADGNGVGNFKYSVPSGYLALCTKNLGS